MNILQQQRSLPYSYISEVVPDEPISKILNLTLSSLLFIINIINANSKSISLKQYINRDLLILQVLLLLLIETSMDKIWLPEISQQVVAETIKQGEQQYNVNYYQIGKYLRRDSFGYCYEARRYRSHTSDSIGDTFVLKVISTKGDSFLAKQIYKNQIQILEQIKDYNNSKFINCIGHWEHRDKCYIVLEKNWHGNLKQLISYSQGKVLTFSQGQIIYFLHQILLALQVLHEKDIVHRNIKLQSIAIDNFSLKLTDFSLAQCMGEQILQDIDKCGTFYYMPPQQSGQKFALWSKQGDIWSVGIILYYCIYLKFPYQGVDQSKFIESLQVEKDIEFPVKNSNYKSIIKIAKQILNKKPQQRPTISQLLKSNIFTNMQQANMKRYLQEKYRIYFEQAMIQRSFWRRKIDKTPLDIPNGIIQKILKRERVVVRDIIRVHKYGYFVLLSNLKLIAYFNNGIVLHFSNRTVYPSNSNQQKILSFIYQKYFKTIVQQKIQEKDPRVYEQSSCSIKKIININQNILIRLSNETLQMFFAKDNNNPSDLQFSTKIYLNYDKKYENRVKFVRDNQQKVYDKFSQGLGQGNRYFEYLKILLQIILDNSMMSGKILTRELNQ